MSDTANRPPPLIAASEWLIALLLSTNLAWTALCLGGVRAETIVWSGALTCTTAAIVAIRQSLLKSFNHPALSWLVPFLLYALLSACVLTPVRWLTLREWLLWVQLFLVLAIALNGQQSKGPRRFVLATTMLLGTVAVALSAYQINGHQSWLMLGRVQALQYVGRASGFLGNPNSLAALYVLLIPPLLALTWRRGASGVQRIACGYAALVLITGLVLTLSRGGWLALTLALTCWPLFVGEWTWPRRIMTTTAVVCIVALSAIALWATLPSARARMELLARDHGERSRVILWQASLKMTADAPILGTGAASFNTVFEKHRPEGFRNNPQWAHNEFLNVLSDYGIVGFALLFGGIGAIAWRYRRPLVPRNTHRTHADNTFAEIAFTRSLGIGLLAFAFACLVDFHMHIPALGMTVAIYAAEFLKRRTPADTSAPKTVSMPALRCVATLAALALFGGIMVKTNRAEALRTAGREQIDSSVGRDQKTPDYYKTLLSASTLLVKAAAQDPENAQAWADNAYALSLQARIEKQNARPFGQRAEDAARKATALAPNVPEFWIRLGVALDLQKRTAEAGDAFTHALQLAPASPLTWYHQAYHLSLTPATRNLALGAAAMCLRLDPSHTDADILRVHLEPKH